MESKIYYAKPVDGKEGTYEHHVERCYEIACNEISSNYEILKSVVKKIG